MSDDLRAPHRRRPWASIGLLALLAYLPPLLAAPGRMPADSKLYLYLNPGRFLVDAAGSFDARQFAGWVPHQHVSYLWPAGPWYWIFDLVGVPDWIAHRLWIGTLLLVAGLGVRWCGRLLGLSGVAAFVAAVVYQISPYVLPYISRTSVMLLPWAGLGWIVALTIRASRRHTWGDPATIALVVFTVGAVNATALAVIIPAPVLWLVHAAWQRAATWRQVTMVAVKVAVFSLGTSVWWIVMLILQGRHGTDVLPYSESLGDVSFTSTSAEVWRGLGYWLFYVRDPYAATTTESLRYLTSTPAIAISFLVPIMCVIGLVGVRWMHRRYAALLVATGVVLAVGVHPIDDRSPLMWLLTGNGDSGLALALRSSTRALPLVSLGLALAAGSVVAASEQLRRRVGPLTVGHLTGGAVIVVVLANMPGLWSGAVVDPALERDQDPPAAWIEAARALDETEADGRVLQLPGIEFGAYRWGYTVDQPLPALTERPLVTRDLLPLGSAAAMDLLYAFDDRVQAGTLEPTSVAPIARLLGVDTIWLTNDVAFDRFRTARPEIVRDLVAGAPGVGPLQSFGEPVANLPDVPMIDEHSLGDPRVGRAAAPVDLAPLDDPGAVVRAATGELIVSGNGDGLVDAAAAGLLDDALAVLYSGALDEPVSALDRATALVVTDTNRAEARHWRSSQDTRGYTESVDPDVALLTEVASDQRLPVFDSDDRTVRTYADHRGGVQATATAYGEPFAYLPEHRPYMAIDGDLDTAWLVGEHGDPVGQKLRLTFVEPVSEIRLRQVTGATHRTITKVLVGGPDGRQPESIVLDDRSRSDGGQPVAVSGSVIEITIDEVAGGVLGTAGAVAGVGFAEVEHDLGPTIEIVRPPNDALALTPASTPLALVFTRLRSDPMDRWRDDPETLIVREFDLASARTVSVAADARVDARATDRRLADLLGWPVAASTRLTGSLRHAGVFAFDGDPATSWITAFGEATGAVVTIADVADPIDSIRVVQPADGFSRVTAVAVRSNGQERLVQLAADDQGAAVALLDPPLRAGDVDIEILEIDPSTTIDRRFGDRVELPAAVAEIELGGVAPVTALAELSLECIEIAEVDGRPIRASFELAAGWLDGAPLEVTSCTDPLALTRGRQLVTSNDLDVPITIDRLVLDDGARRAIGTARSSARATVTERSRFGRTVTVSGCDSGCWLVLGEGYNPAWTASVDGSDLGEPVLIDGGFNGWRIRASSTPVTVELRWTAQRPLTIALLASAILAAFALLIALSDRYRNISAALPSGPAAQWAIADDLRLDRTRASIGAAVWVVASGLLIGPGWALLGLLAGGALVWTRRARLGELTTLATLVAIGGATVVLERRDMPFPGGGWPATFEVLHGFGMFAVASLLVGAVLAPDDHGIDDADDQRTMPVAAR